MTRHVIVGAGEAGLRAAIALRDAGEAQIVLLHGEADPTYERPALSKPDGEGGFHRPVRANTTGIDVRPGVTVTRIDRADRTVITDGGGAVGFDRLLLATGARPRRLACDPGRVALPLRTLDDARRIYAGAAAGRSAIIIGAGLIGLELAAELRRREMDVLVLEAGPRALGRAVPAEMADAIVERHRKAGARFAFRQAIERIEPGCVLLTDGRACPADLIVAAVGVEPETRLAEDAGLACANGIRVDATLRTSDPVIFAAGDCAAVDHPRYGVIRFETWRNACDQGAHAARAMIGSSQRFDALPWFWSDHHDLGLQVVGLHDPGRTAVRRDLASGGWLRFELDDDGRLASAAGIGRGTTVAKDIRLAEMLIERRRVCAPADLADAGFNLKAALRGS